jgi:hypothetical protein
MIMIIEKTEQRGIGREREREKISVRGPNKDVGK